MGVGPAKTPRMAVLKTILILVHWSHDLKGSKVYELFFPEDRAQQVGEGLSIGPGFFLSLCCNEHSEVFSYRGCSLVLPQVLLLFCHIRLCHCCFGVT